MKWDIDVKIATIVFTKIACLASPPQPMRSSKTSFSNSMSNHSLQNSTTKEPRDIVMLVGNMSKVSSAIALKRTWICTLVVSGSRKNSKLAMWNFTFVRLSQGANFSWIELSEIEVWAYVSECGEYNFHVSSITEIIVEELENETTNILALKNLGLPIQRGLKRSYYFWFIPLLFVKIALISKNKTS